MRIQNDSKRSEEINMPLCKLVYMSRPVENTDNVEFEKILAQSSINNKKQGITGMLYFGRDIFLQALEGPRFSVSQLYEKLCRDPRHYDIEILYFDEIENRAFDSWAMGKPAKTDGMEEVFMKYTDAKVLKFETLQHLSGLKIWRMMLDIRYRMSVQSLAQ